MPLDPTISLEAGRGVTPNLLATAAQDPAQLQNLLALQGKSVAGQAFQSSIDPATGQLDQAAFGNRLAADPRARFVAPEMFKQSIDVAHNQQVLAEQRKQALLQGVVPLLQDLNVSVDTYKDQVQQLVRQGVINPMQATNEISSLYPNGQPLDKSALNLKLTEHLANLLPPDSQKNLFLGEPVQVSDGKNMHFFRLSQNGLLPLGPSIPLKLSPAEEAGIVPRMVTPTGVPLAVTGAQTQQAAPAAVQSTPPGGATPMAQGSAG